MEHTIANVWIVQGIIFTLVYGYESLGFAKDPEHCYAKEGSDSIATNFDAAEDDTDYVDVGERFHIVFTINYYAAMIVGLSGILHSFEVKAIRLVTRAFGTLAQQLMGVTALVGIVFRLLHTGQVCSGDFLEEDELKDSSGYLTSQGWLLMLFVYIWIIMCACGLLTAALAFIRGLC